MAPDMRHTKCTEHLELALKEAVLMKAMATAMATVQERLLVWLRMASGPAVRSLSNGHGLSCRLSYALLCIHVPAELLDPTFLMPVKKAHSCKSYSLQTVLDAW
jgi:hypothetical protein